MYFLLVPVPFFFFFVSFYKGKDLWGFIHIFDKKKYWLHWYYLSSIFIEEREGLQPQLFV